MTLENLLGMCYHSVLLCIFSGLFQESAQEKNPESQDESAEKRLAQEMNGAFPSTCTPSQHSSAGKESAQQEAQAQFPAGKFHRRRN